MGWPKPREKVEKVGIEYYLDAFENNGLKGNLKQPEKFTTCGKLGIEINQYNNPVECYHEEVVEEMMTDQLFLTNPDLMEKMKDKEEKKATGPFDPERSCVLAVIDDN